MSHAVSTNILPPPVFPSLFNTNKSILEWVQLIVPLAPVGAVVTNPTVVQFDSHYHGN